MASQWAIRCVLIMLFVCVRLRPVVSLKCYECTESEATTCGEPFDKNRTSIVDCDTSIYTIGANATERKSFVCMFLKETDVIGRKSSYTRRCAVKNLGDTCENTIANNKAQDPGVQTACRQCDYDLCNASSKLFASFSVFVCFCILKF